MVAWPVAEPIHSSPILRMAFNLKKVLKALLYSSSQPLSTKDIQGVFERFHRMSAPAAPADAAVPESGDAPAEAPDSPDLYDEVPSLVTTAMIRETMDEIAAEVAAADDGLSLVDARTATAWRPSPALPAGSASCARSRRR